MEKYKIMVVKCTFVILFAFNRPVLARGVIKYDKSISTVIIWK